MSFRRPLAVVSITISGYTLAVTTSMSGDLFGTECSLLRPTDRQIFAHISSFIAYVWKLDVISCCFKWPLECFKLKDMFILESIFGKFSQYVQQGEHKHVKHTTCARERITHCQECNLWLKSEATWDRGYHCLTCWDLNMLYYSVSSEWERAPNLVDYWW